MYQIWHGLFALYNKIIFCLICNLSAFNIKRKVKSKFFCFEFSFLRKLSNKSRHFSFRNKEKKISKINTAYGNDKRAQRAKDPNRIVLLCAVYGVYSTTNKLASMNTKSPNMPHNYNGNTVEMPLNLYYFMNI